MTTMIPMEKDLEADLRAQMVQHQLRQRDIHDEKVLSVMSQLPRQLFIPQDYRHQAYLDQPVPIGNGQTISQPYIVALMTEALALQGHHKVLEIGTGCGYQTAILARLAQHVYTVELLDELSLRARQILTQLGIDNVEFHIGDGHLGWPDKMIFDRVLVAAVAQSVPPILLEQLTDGGKMVIPVGSGDHQKLLVVDKQGQTTRESLLCYCRFVPLLKTN